MLKSFLQPLQRKRGAPSFQQHFLACIAVLELERIALEEI